MVKKRVSRRNSSRSPVRRNNLRKVDSVSNSLRKNSSSFLNTFSSLTQMPITEKGLLVALLVFIGIVAFSTNSSTINQITGSFTQVTGEQALTGADLGVRISGIFSLITDGLLAPVFGLLSPTPNILFIKLLLVIILYFILSFAGLGSMFGGKGKFIAGVISFLGVALLPESIVNLYIINLIPGFLAFLLSLIAVIFFIVVLHKIKVESRPGHALKALLYFLLFILIPALEVVLFDEIVVGD